jgi:hypothetical protein
MPGMGRVQGIAVILECSACCVEHARGPAQVARGESDFSLGDDTSRTGNCVFGPEGTRRTSQERLSAGKIPKLCHGDSSKRERRCIVAQRNSFECAEGIS